MSGSRHRYAWNLYNKYQNQVSRFGRKQGYSNESLQEHVKQYEEVDEGKGKKLLLLMCVGVGVKTRV